MSERIRVGMIGVGSMAQQHIERLLQIHRAAVVAICDPSEESLNKTLERQSDLVEEVEQFSDYKEMLSTAKPDAVIISSPHADHFPQIIDSLEAGAHVLTEKPLVNSVDDAKTIIKKTEKAGKVVGIAYQRHTMPQYRFIKKAITSGEYGRVHAVAGLQQQGWKRGTTGTWRQNPKIAGGGQLHDSGSHLIDILLWTTGLTAESVAANIDKRGTEVDINSALTVRFREDAVGTIAVIGDGIGWREDLTIWCDHGTFFIREDKFSVQRPDRSFWTPAEGELPQGSNIISNFIAAIDGEEPIAAPLVCGLRTLELTEAAWRSAEHGGKPVAVDHND